MTSAGEARCFWLAALLGGYYLRYTTHGWTEALGTFLIAGFWIALLVELVRQYQVRSQ